MTRSSSRAPKAAHEREPAPHLKDSSGKGELEISVSSVWAACGLSPRRRRDLLLARFVP